MARACIAFACRQHDQWMTTLPGCFRTMPTPSCHSKRPRSSGSAKGAQLNTGLETLSSSLSKQENGSHEDSRAARLPEAGIRGTRLNRCPGQPFGSAHWIPLKADKFREEASDDNSIDGPGPGRVLNLFKPRPEDSGD